MNEQEIEILKLAVSMRNADMEYKKTCLGTSADWTVYQLHVYVERLKSAIEDSLEGKE